jgi:hypothetical protein
MQQIMNVNFPRTSIRASAIALSLLTLAGLNVVPIRAADAAEQSGAYAAAGLADCGLDLGDSIRYASGEQSSVALHSSGLLVEFHKVKYDTAIVYRVGKLNGTSVTWGEPLSPGSYLGTRYWPTVVLSKEGYVVFVYSDREHKSNSQLFYRVGWIDPNGNERQIIRWKTDVMFWDNGFHNSIAMNDNGVIASVHETHGSSNSLFYRIGHLRNPAGGDYTIAWDSGSWGIEYDRGINPHIAINNHNEVVAVHQVPGETLLHYRRGTVVEDHINFTESMRYDNHAEQPAIALLDSGRVLEVHSLGGLITREGQLSLSNPALIEWATPVKVNPRTTVAYPAVATNGIHAVKTYEDWPDGAYSSVSLLCVE